MLSTILTPQAQTALRQNKRLLCRTREVVVNKEDWFRWARLALEEVDGAVVAVRITRHARYYKHGAAGTHTRRGKVAEYTDVSEASVARLRKAMQETPNECDARWDVRYELQGLEWRRG